MAYTTKGVRFDGTNDYLSRGAALSGAADGRVGLCSFWFRVMGGDGTYRAILEDSDGGNNQIGFTSANKLFIQWRDAASTIGPAASSVATFTAGMGWTHFLASWDMDTMGVSSGRCKLYINDVFDVELIGSGGGDLDYTKTDWFFCARSGGGLKCDIEIADFWFSIASALNLDTASNRRKFITADLKLVDLGSTGTAPGLGAPIIFFKGPASSFNTNLGTGGNFTVTGALVDSATDPPSAGVAGDLKLYGSALDSGLAYLANCDKLYICSAVPTTYSQAITAGTYALGNANVTPGAPAAATGSGRKVTVPAITAGSVTTTGTPTYWALVRTGLTELVATGQLTGVALTSGQTFTLQAMTIIQAGVSV